MDPTSEQLPPAVKSFIARTHLVTSGAEHHVPSWLRPGDPENRLPVIVAILAAVTLQRVIPDQYTIPAVPRWPLITLELLLVVVLMIINPVRLSRRSTIGKSAMLVLTAAITLDNIASAIILDLSILSGKVSNDAGVLLGSGAAVFITNVIVFGIWYWELDRGGPFARRAGDNPYPDFQFPQMCDPQNAKPGWRPTFVDYLYTSYTNVVAFSPTDTMPLSRWAKSMMTLQSLVALSTIALVIARAVNVLK
ncbi:MULTISPECIES: hypothetical protein [unclassified Mycolicibacterium]|uniref:hypothetical protein n=1 Tax=unclassified Mycolicibacterium TaxID=2636767 RepID=UPI001EE4E4CC|nr:MULTISPECIES: hypothetical protein [unclassified Mycolicibacterium]